MPRRKANKQEANVERHFPPAETQEGRENQLISLAMDLAEKQMLEGTASSQIITHFLELATEQEKRKNEVLEQQLKLMQAKTESLQSSKRIEELYADAMRAFTDYSPTRDDDRGTNPL